MTVQPIAGGLLEADRFLINGDVAEVKVRVDALGDEANSIPGALAGDEFRSSLHGELASKLKKHLGKEYEASLVSAENETVATTISTASAEVSGPEDLTKKVGKLAGALAEQLSKELKRTGVDDKCFTVRSSWDLSAQVQEVVQPISRQSSEEQLQSQLDRLLARRRQYSRQRHRAVMLLVAPLMIIPVTGVVALAIPDSSFLAGAFGGYALLFAALGFAGWSINGTQLADADADIRQLTDEIDLREIATDDREPRAQKLFQAHSSEIKRYYDQALRQAKNVYFVGVFSIGLGVAVIAATFILILNDSASSSDQQWIIGALGAIGAVLANFIAVIYLRMFSDSIQALTGFHGRLVLTHHLHFGNFLVAKIEDDDLRDKTLAEMADAVSAEKLPDGSGFDASAGLASASGRVGTSEDQKADNNPQGG
jgi:hypothetical protein